MTRLEVYNSIDEIKKTFDITRIIEKETEFQKLVTDLENSDEFIYRGINDASFKMYSSSQRDYVVKGLSNKFGNYIDYLKSIYNHSKSVRKGLLLKFYDATRQNLRYFPSQQQGYIEENLPYNSFWAFSFIQHYGIPSPLIDFSGSFLASLFFAWDNALEVKNSYLLNDYMQINYFNKEELQKQNNFQSIMKHSISEAKKLNLQNVNSATQNFMTYFDFFNITTSKIYYVDKSGATRTLKRVPVTFDINIDFNIFNLNIIAQDGLFIPNPDENKCLEDIWNNLSLPKMKKILIHKSLVKNIETVLKQNAGNNVKEAYYPQEEEVVNDLYNNVLK